MPATVTLATTTLSAGVGPADRAVLLASTAGVFQGYRLFVDKELMQVVSFGVGNWVNVQRGVDGTSASAHNSSATVTIGKGDQFYSVDPVGRPDAATEVSPYINVVNGKVWLAQGDNLPTSTANRWWQEVTTTYGIGPLGVNVSTSAPTVAS